MQNSWYIIFLKLKKLWKWGIYFRPDRGQRQWEKQCGGAAGSHKTILEHLAAEQLQKKKKSDVLCVWKKNVRWENDSATPTSSNQSCEPVISVHCVAADVLWTEHSVVYLLFGNHLTKSLSVCISRRGPAKENLREREEKEQMSKGTSRQAWPCNSLCGPQGAQECCFLCY